MRVIVIQIVRQPRKVGRDFGDLFLVLTLLFTNCVTLGKVPLPLMANGSNVYVAHFIEQL